MKRIIVFYTTALFTWFCWVAYPIQSDTRPTCEHLNRCNLSTGEVFDMEAIEAAQAYATLFEE